MKTPDENENASATEAVELWDTKLVLVSEKNTRQPTPKEVKELVESIRATGQITPAIARPHPTEKGHLELAAGARRRTACDVLGIKLKVVVHEEMTDAELEDWILTDNLQREDPDPEAEADLIKRRLDEGAKPSEIAARYGKKENWVLRRMKLLDVIPEIRKRWAKGLSHFTVEMRERVGALPKELQKSLNSAAWKLEQLTCMKALEELVVRHTADLKGCAEWLNDPDTFIAGCGPGCATDSSKDLFSDGKGCGHCQNPGCFVKRLALATDKAITAALDGRKLTDVVIFTSSSYGKITYHGKEHQLLGKWNFEDAYTISKEPTDLAGLNFANPYKPKLVFLAKKKKASGGSSTPGKKEPRETAVHAKRRAVINKLIADALAKAPRPASPSILVLVGAFGTHSNRNSSFNSRPQDWDTVDDGKTGRSFEVMKAEKKLPIEDALWESVRIVLGGRLTFHKNGDLMGKGREEEMKRTAALIGLDYDKEYARICTEEVKVPKSWGPGIDPITLKATAQHGTNPSGKSKLAAAAGTAKPAKKAAKKAAAKTPAKKAAKKPKPTKA